MPVQFLDIDHFKGITNRLGHAAGDDEFIVLLEGLPAAVEAVARMIIGSLNANMTIGARALRVTTSIGIAGIDSGELDPHELMAYAAKRLYLVRADGRDTYY